MYRNRQRLTTDKAVLSPINHSARGRPPHPNPLPGSTELTEVRGTGGEGIDPAARKSFRCYFFCAPPDTVSIRVIMGANRAMTIKPTITPRTTTMTGSRMLISEPVMVVVLG